MNRRIKIAVIIAVCLSFNPAWADKISGVPRADFHSNELTVPCVQVKNFDDNTALNDQFFDIILTRRGKSFNYELTFSASESQEHCQRVADFAAFDDDDFDDSSDDENSTSGTDGLKILASCEKRTSRSKISVNGKNLVSGNYSANVTSGGVTVASEVKASNGDEIEFDFDSSTGDIAKGATAIGADFIAEGILDAQIIDGGSGETVIRVENVVCAIRG